MFSQFIISLDFELHWGVFDHVHLNSKGKAYFQITRTLIPKVLNLFKDNNIHCTWATVGFLFAKDKKQLKKLLPDKHPNYERAVYNPYPIIKDIGKNEQHDPFHFGHTLIEKIVETPGQELASHTFSHYYCLEPGQGVDDFRSDLEAAQYIAKKNFGVELRSLVFPRNQYRPNYMETLKQTGFYYYRTNPNIWFWKPVASNTESKKQKATRLLDHYFNIDKNTSFPEPSSNNGLTAVPASRFFRPYIKKLDGFGGQHLKVKRICNEMTVAARNNLCYHLWWHPHNLATHPEKNMQALEKIILHYRYLNQEYGMESRAMNEINRGQKSDRFTVRGQTV